MSRNSLNREQVIRLTGTLISMKHEIDQENYTPKRLAERATTEVGFHVTPANLKHMAIAGILPSRFRHNEKKTTASVSADVKALRAFTEKSIERIDQDIRALFQMAAQLEQNCKR